MQNSCFWLIVNQRQEGWGIHKLNLNSDKMKVLWVGGSCDLRGGDHCSWGSVAVFGLTFREAQVASTSWNSFYHLWLVHKLWPLLDDNSLATVIHTLATSYLEHCSVLYTAMSCTRRCFEASFSTKYSSMFINWDHSCRTYYVNLKSATLTVSVQNGKFWF